MKRCPQCNRVESDDSLAFCRADGAALVSESSSPVSEGATAQLGSATEASELHTSILPHNTNPGVDRATGPTTTLPTPSISKTRQLSTTGKRKAPIVLAAAFLLVVDGLAAEWAALGRFKSASKEKAIESVAVLT